MANIDELTKQCASALMNENSLPDEIRLIEIVKGMSFGLGLIAANEGPYSEAEIMDVVGHLMTRFDTKMESEIMVDDDDYEPWLLNKNEQIDPYYWSRYRENLIRNKGFDPPVVTKIDKITHDILDRLKDPAAPGPWRKRGMVVGHVQSGKTANYTGLVCKAADAGYKVIIILAGLLNSLRDQTQERIDSDFIGRCTITKDDIGSANFCDRDKRRYPVCLTTKVEDFNKKTANSIAMSLDALNEPIVLVLKKNKSSLENLRKWLSEHNKYDLKDFPMLLIDDEADHASVNTNKKEDSPTTINLAIRDLLSIFERNAYVGYTATPFANIFIDPDNENEMKNGLLYKDLFPRNFILNLPAPSNYIGPGRIFSNDTNLDCLRSIDDNEDLLPIKHKIDFEPVALPESLNEALNCFIIARSIRILRAHKGVHSSMMINVSRFTNIQDQILTLTLNQVMALKDAIANYAALPTNDAEKNSLISSIYTTWKDNYQTLEFSWEKVLKSLKEATARIEVICVNTTSNEELDYTNNKYPNGRNVIAIGGLSLSRGLTLEGLLVSYFLRNSIMYDTLMQMGRWFGYRDKYADVCKVFMTDDAQAWYTHITEATEELRDEFRHMKGSITPLQFGLKVKSHPASLIVTARNKMRDGVTVPHRISLEGRLIETLALYYDSSTTKKNLELVNEIVVRADQERKHERTRLGYFWQNVDTSLIKYFVEKFINHPMSLYTYHHEALQDYLDEIQLPDAGCDILLKTLNPSKTNDKPLLIGKGLIGSFQNRKDTAVIKDGFVSFKKNGRLGEPKDERAGLPKEVVEQLEKGEKTINPKLYRSVPGRRPLLIIHIINLENENKRQVCGYGLSFPGEAITSRPQKLVEYVVNTTYLKNTHGDELDEESCE